MKKIPIFFACDDNYIPFLAVTLESLKQNSSSQNYYDIKILSINVNPDLVKLINKYICDNISIEFVDMIKYIENIDSELHTRDYYSKTTYYRLFIPRMYPNIDKCLYLDCDIIIRNDIANLFMFDIGDNLVGGIPDEIVYKTSELRDYAQKRLGIIPERYINAGILVMNLKKLREFDFENKFIKLLKRVKFVVAQDQDYINTICKDRIFYLPMGWNKQPMPDNITENELNLIHYNLNLKPWHYDNILFEEYFWQYAKNTEFIQKINEMKQNYDDERVKKDSADWKNLLGFAVRDSLLGTVENE